MNDLGWKVLKEVERSGEWVLVAVGHAGTEELAWNLAEFFTVEGVKAQEKTRVTVVNPK